MTLVFPRHVTRGHFWQQADFSMQYRHEMSESGNNQSYVKQLSAPVWKATYLSAPMEKDPAYALYADLETMQGGLNTFFAHTDERRGPISETIGTPAINAIRGDSAGIRIDGLPAGLEIGAADFFGITTASGIELCRVAAPYTVSGTGLSPWMDLTTALRPSVQVGDAVEVIDPYMEARLVSDTLKISRVSGDVLHTVGFECVQVVK